MAANPPKPVQPAEKPLAAAVSPSPLRPGEFRLLPPEGKTPEELLGPAPAVKLPEAEGQIKRSPFQFSIGELMLITVGVSLGAAGYHWFPVDIYAAILGLFTLVGLIVVSHNPPESRRAKIIWAMLIVAYAVAVAMAVFKRP